MAKDPARPLPDARATLGRAALAAAQDRADEPERSVAAGDAAPASPRRSAAMPLPPALAVETGGGRVRRPRGGAGGARAPLRRGRGRRAPVRAALRRARDRQDAAGHRARPRAPTPRARPCSTAARTPSRWSPTSRSSPRSQHYVAHREHARAARRARARADRARALRPGAAHARAGARASRSPRSPRRAATGCSRRVTRLLAFVARERPVGADPRRPALGGRVDDAAARPPAPGRRADAAARARHRATERFELASCWRGCAASARFERSTLERPRPPRRRARWSPRDDVTSAVRRSACTSETEGNPFFIEETLRSLPELEERALSRIAVPEGVKEMIARRLAQLSRDRQPGAERRRGGRPPVRPRAARGAARRPDDALDALEEAIAAGLVREADETSTASPSRTRSCARRSTSSQSASRRVRLHRRIGEALEAARATPTPPSSPTTSSRAAPTARPSTTRSAPPSRRPPRSPTRRPPSTTGARGRRRLADRALALGARRAARRRSRGARDVRARRRRSPAREGDRDALGRGRARLLRPPRRGGRRRPRRDRAARGGARRPAPSDQRCSPCGCARGSSTACSSPRARTRAAGAQRRGAGRWRSGSTTRGARSSRSRAATPRCCTSTTSTSGCALERGAARRWRRGSASASWRRSATTGASTTCSRPAAIEDARDAHRRARHARRGAAPAALSATSRVGWEVVWAQMAGRVDDAERLAREAFELGRAPRPATPTTIYAAQNADPAPARGRACRTTSRRSTAYVERNPALRRLARDPADGAPDRPANAQAGVAQFRALAQRRLRRDPARHVLVHRDRAARRDVRADRRRRAAPRPLPPARAALATSSCRSARPRASAPTHRFLALLARRAGRPRPRPSSTSSPALERNAGCGLRPVVALMRREYAEMLLARDARRPSARRRAARARRCARPRRAACRS